jgi:hypothetical protein
VAVACVGAASHLAGGDVKRADKVAVPWRT